MNPHLRSLSATLALVGGAIVLAAIGWRTLTSPPEAPVMPVD